MNIFDGIRSSYLAEGLSSDQVQAIASLADEVVHSDNEEIVREFDESADDIFILLKGKVRVTTASGELIARLNAGAIIGEIALFVNARRSASVISDGESNLARINATKFNALFESQPALGVIVLRNLGKTVTQRLRSSNVQLEAVLKGLDY